jgi:hypothetical protein
MCGPHVPGQAAVHQGVHCMVRQGMGSDREAGAFWVLRKQQGGQCGWRDRNREDMR